MSGAAGETFSNQANGQMNSAGGAQSAVETRRFAHSAPQRCPACDAKPHQSFRLANGTRLLRCPRCLMGWWNWSAAGGFDPAQFYDQAYFQSADVSRGYDDYGSLEAGIRKTARARLRRIAALWHGPDAATPGRLLEVGCGTGSFLEEARRAAWEARGIEVSAFAAARARQRGLPVSCAAIEEVALPAQEYDCVVLWDVIEHLRDPAGVLRGLGRAVRPRGALALSTGDITSLCARVAGPRWHLFNLPEHLYFFSPQALKRMLSAAGLRVQRVTREANWVPAAYLPERLRKSGGRRRPGRAVARWIVPATLFDVLGVYANRAGE